MKKTILSLLSICVLFTLSNNIYAQKKEAPAKKGPPDKLLAGKIFTIELVGQGKKAGDPEADEISFKGGVFTSNLMKKENEFKPGPYTVEADSSAEAGKTLSFESEMKNPSDEVLAWKGTITKDDIEGTATWTNKKGKTKKEYTFTGSKKDPKAAKKKKED